MDSTALTISDTVASSSRVAQSRRVRSAAQSLGIPPVTFIAWMLDRSARAGDPVAGWKIPWAVEVTTATRLRRDVRVVRRVRSGWRVVLTFHGKPFAMIVPITRPRADDLDEPAQDGGAKTSARGRGTRRD
jgi:antitoxin (DNA-binding transcriptional repressor) of toxin-antitoxin stability system